jgi:tRNA(Ile2) C34 agmatinyltransferase TiaS
MACIFCGWTAPGRWALTVHHTGGAWERVVEPVCSRCNRLLRNAGRSGCRFKVTGERWYAGHT